MQLPTKQLLSLLVHAYNNSIKDFYYFPEVVFIGEQRVSKEEFDILWSEGYLEQYQHDSFGRFYKLSKKAEDCIHESVVVKASKKKKYVIPASQGQLHFV
jgi:hypothetical protein